MGRLSPLKGSVWRRHILVLAGLILLAGCANGDFGRVRPDLVSDDIHDWVGRDAAAQQHIAPSHFPLTDDERALRDLAYPLIQPPYDRHKWYSVAGEYGLIERDHRLAFDRAAYFNRLRETDDRSSSARYGRLLDDIRNDETRLPEFFETAARVLAIDDKRHTSLQYISGLSPKERANALSRGDENAAIVALVRDKLAQRVSSYRFALEHLVVMTPSAQAVTVERTLNRLQDTIARYERYPAPTWAHRRSLASIR